MYPSPFYRVVAKAFITNQAGHVLVVRESDEFWSLPGGGLEHGETAATCLKREIKEELGIGSLLLEAQGGPLSSDDTRRSIKLLGEEVIPALQD